MYPFLIALQFLTQIPVRLDCHPSQQEVGRSLLYYPLVGLLIGAFLALFAWLLVDAPPLMSAALLLTIWVLLAGGLHLDGLADSADAWVGGLGDQVRTLEIMKDPTCGPAGVVSLVLVLLIKFSALHAILESGNWAILLLAPLFGRTALLLLFLTTPYVRKQGLGSALSEHLPRTHIVWVLVVILIGIVSIFGSSALWLLLTVGLVFVGLRYLMMQRLGGTTGDVAGALVEIIETTVLVVGAFQLYVLK